MSGPPTPTVEGGILTLFGTGARSCQIMRGTKFRSALAGKILRALPKGGFFATFDWHSIIRDPIPRRGDDFRAGYGHSRIPPRGLRSVLQRERQGHQQAGTDYALDGV